ncbi:MAG TPA: substrate-binding domain-containing protein [Usitatibacter sp.]|nr:substrate-binding domain-containing protein [Usitatibacter sp.]
MHKLAIRPTWVLREHAGDAQLMPRLLQLLGAIHETGSLASACARTGHSYRHGWGVVREARQIFGAPLIESVRGRGARLTPLGEKLVWAEQRIAARLGPTLESLASELESELARASSDALGVLRIRASHAFALTALRDFTARRHHPTLEVTYEAGADALASLHHAGCDAAGFHVPEGALEAALLPLYARWLDPQVHRLVQIVTRRQGIIVAPGNPRDVTSIADLARPQVRFVNRQPGSGTRLVLENLLARARIKPARIHGYDRVEYTHAAVAAYIASGMADAGLGVETAARQFQLGFIPLVQERYFLALRRETLQSPPVERLLEAMRSREFRTQLVRLQGLDGAQCGTVLELREAFPHFAGWAKERRRPARLRRP